MKSVGEPWSFGAGSSGTFRDPSRSRVHDGSIYKYHLFMVCVFTPKRESRKGIKKEHASAVCIWSVSQSRRALVAPECGIIERSRFKDDPAPIPNIGLGLSLWMDGWMDGVTIVL